MKIVYLHQYFNTGESSGGSRSFEFAKRLVEAGHEVHMVTSDRTPSGRSHRWSTEEVEGIRVHWLKVPYSNAMSFGRRLIAFVQFALGSAVRARQLRADLVFATSTPLTIAIPGWFATVFRKSPMVFEVRDLWPDMPIAVGALKNPVAIKMARALEQFAYSRSEAVVALSPGMRAGVIAAGYPAEKIVLLPNACDLDQFDVSSTAVQAWRHSHTWLGERPMVLYCGTFGLLNRVEYMADLAAEVLPLNPEVRFVTVGSGAGMETVRKRAEERGVLDVNFFILPPIPKSKIPVVFAASTISTSLFAPIKEMEANSANKFFDSLAAGRPVAINYGGWQEELLTSSGAGIRLDPSDYQMAAKQLTELIADDHRLARASVAARKLASKSFSRDDIAAQLLELFEKVVRK